MANTATVVQTLADVSATASHTLEHVSGDAELSALAASTQSWANQEREKIAFLRADTATLTGLFPGLHPVHDDVFAASFEEVLVYFKIPAGGG